MPRETAKNEKSAQAAENREGIVQGKAEKKEKPVEAARGKVESVQGQAEGKEKNHAKGPIYLAEELAGNARNIFNTRQECVSAALEAAGKEECTVAEAKEIVKKFLEKEVK